MARNASIPTLPPSGAPLDAYGWDWSATTHDATGSDTTAAWVAAELVDSLGGSTLLPGKGLQGWGQSVQSFDADGFRLGTVYFSGDDRISGQRPDVHVVATSAAADAVRPLVAGRYGAKTARVDTRVDTLLPFEELQAICLGLGGRGTQVVFMESRTLNGQGEDSTAGGRTLYVGAPSSAVRIRVYEKWLEAPDQYVEGTNRVEVQLRPPSKTKASVSTWAPADTFCASRLTRRLADALSLEVAEPGSLQISKGAPDLEASLKAMGDQYGRAAREWLTLSGGDAGTLLDYLTRQKGTPTDD